MSLLSICQDVADVIGLTRPTAIITGTDQLSRQMLGFAKETLEELGEMAWPVLEVAYSFSTVVGQSAYSLPADFGSEVGDSVYVSSQYERIRGSLRAADWQSQRLTNPDIGRYRFRIFGYPSMLYLTPVPQTVETIVLEYVTTNRVAQVAGALKATYFDDTDMPLVPEDLVKKGLKWRVRHAKGLDYSEEFDDYEIARTQRLAKLLSMGSMPVAVRSRFETPEL